MDDWYLVGSSYQYMLSVYVVSDYCLKSKNIFKIIISLLYSAMEHLCKLHVVLCNQILYNIEN